MKNRERERNGGEPSPPGDLSRLIETEERLGRVLATAREEAARIVVAAREAVAAAELELERDLARDRGRVQGEVEKEGADRSAKLVAEARHAAGLLDALPDKRIRELAAAVVERLINPLDGAK